MRTNAVFHDLVNEFIWLADQGAYIPRTIISKILDDGKDVFQYLEHVLPMKTNFSLLDATKEREFYLEVLIRQNTVREKHAVAKRNGILFLLNACHILENKDLFDQYLDTEIEEYQGKFTVEEMDELKSRDVRADEINYY
jgi:hypothetical protein